MKIGHQSRNTRINRIADKIRDSDLFYMLKLPIVCEPNMNYPGIISVCAREKQAGKTLGEREYPLR